MADSIVIASAARTPIGGLLGDFASLAAADLGAVAIRAAVERAGVSGDAVDEVLMGNCLMAGQGQAPARQAALKAGLPHSAGAVTLSKMCGSGMRAMMFAHDMLAAGSAEVMVAGGMESMSNAPHLMFARKGVKYGATQLFDHMAMDGLEDAYERGKAMGVFAESCVAKYGFTREAQDAYAITSTQRAKAANEDGSFDWEIAPVTLASAKGDTVIGRDEQPSDWATSLAHADTAVLYMASHEARQGAATLLSPAYLVQQLQTGAFLGLVASLDPKARQDEQQDRDRDRCADEARHGLRPLAEDHRAEVAVAHRERFIPAGGGLAVPEPRPGGALGGDAAVGQVAVAHHDRGA